MADAGDSAGVQKPGSFPGEAGSTPAPATITTDPAELGENSAPWPPRNALSWRPSPPVRGAVKVVARQIHETAEAYRGGQIAYRAARPLQRNPYPLDDGLRTAWEQGWLKAAREDAW